MPRQHLHPRPWMLRLPVEAVPSSCRAQLISPGASLRRGLCVQTSTLRASSNNSTTR